jgi:hypothetical protein
MKRLLLLFFVLGILTSTSIQAMDMEDYAAGDETCTTGGDGGCSGLHGDEDDPGGPCGDD